MISDHVIDRGRDQFRFYFWSSSFGEARLSPLICVHTRKTKDEFEPISGTRLDITLSLSRLGLFESRQCTHSRRLSRLLQLLLGQRLLGVAEHGLGHLQQRQTQREQTTIDQLKRNKRSCHRNTFESEEEKAFGKKLRASDSRGNETLLIFEFGGIRKRDIQTDR